MRTSRKRSAVSNPLGQVYSTAYYTPPTTPPPPPGQVEVTVYTSLEDMTPEEGVLWLEQLRAEILEMKQNSQNYVARRASQGRRTPTDVMYERHIASLDKTLLLIDRTLKEVKKGNP